MLSSWLNQSNVRDVESLTRRSAVQDLTLRTATIRALVKTRITTVVVQDVSLTNDGGSKNIMDSLLTSI